MARFSHPAPDEARAIKWNATGRAAYGRWWKISHRHPGWEGLLAALPEYDENDERRSRGITNPGVKSNRELLLEAARRERNGRRG